MKKISTPALLADSIQSWSKKISIAMIVLFVLSGFYEDFIGKKLIGDRDLTFLIFAGGATVTIVFGQIAAYFFAEKFQKDELTICIRTYLNPVAFSYRDDDKLFIVFEIKKDKLLAAEVIEKVTRRKVKQIIKVGYKKWYDLRDISIAAYKANDIFIIKGFDGTFPFTQLIDSQNHVLYIP